MNEQNNNTISALLDKCIVEPIKKKFSDHADEIRSLRDELSGLAGKLNELSTISQTGLQGLQKTISMVEGLAEQAKRNSHRCKALTVWLAVVALFAVASFGAVVFLIFK